MLTHLWIFHVFYVFSNICFVYYWKYVFLNLSEFLNLNFQDIQYLASHELCISCVCNVNIHNSNASFKYVVLVLFLKHTHTSPLYLHVCWTPVSASIPFILYHFNETVFGQLYFVNLHIALVCFNNLLFLMIPTLYCYVFCYLYMKERFLKENMALSVSFFVLQRCWRSWTNSAERKSLQTWK